ncbi:MAG: FCD domain-containing protein [Burkholderiales bacterium]|nr:FCD domain-containing protein [Burkholderiales bacterium]
MTKAPSAAQVVDMLRSQTLVGAVQGEIERMILDGELKMGERVNEIALATRLNVSRGPVREACRSLAQAGLIESQVNRGFFVRKLALKEVVDLYDLRAGLMRIAGKLIASRITNERLGRIRALVDEMDDARRRDEDARFRDLNSEFHAALVEAADNRRLAEIYQGLVKEIRLYRRGLVSTGAMELSNREHRLILDAIVAKDGERTAVAMEDHILQGKARFLAAASGQIDE